MKHEEPSKCSYTCLSFCSHANIWIIAYTLKPAQFVLTPYLEIVKDPSLYPVEEFFEITTKYNLRSDHIATLRHVVHALGNREEVFGQEELDKLKTKSVTVYGQPHTGKTSLFRTVEKHLGGDIFYFVGTRANDFQGYEPNNRSIVIIDDRFNIAYMDVKAVCKWFKDILLKLYAGEWVRTDRKYNIAI